MKPIYFFSGLMMFAACNQQAGDLQKLKAKIDSLQNQVNYSYKPGFGEFMSSIQVHHNKLWFAGQNQNWKLADFEMHEIMETIEDIRKYQSERKESQLIGMLNPALDSMNMSIHQQNPAQFKSSYTLLTNSCNNCHRTAEFEFNVVKIPENPPFSNQDFKAVK